MPTLTGGEAIVQSLLDHGVDTFFGLPGVQNDYLYNAVYDAGGRLRVIHTRHEQGAAYMALGYALSSDRVGVYNVVPGPGFLNTTAALATAYGANAKVLCLTGQIHSNHIGRGYGMLHEIPDQLAVMRTLTKWAERIKTPAEAPRLVATAFHQLHSDRPRPVGLEVPLDVLSAKAEIDRPAFPPAVRKPAVDLQAIEDAARVLGQARQPLIFVGGGAQAAGAEIRALAEALQAPVVASYNGLGILSSRHYLSHTVPAGHRLWATTDVVLAVGTRLQRPLMDWGLDDEIKVIRIDIDPEEHTRIAPPAVSLVADARDALQALLPAVAAHNPVRSSRKAEMETLKQQVQAELEDHLQPQMALLHAIRAELPDNGIFVEDLTQVGYVSRVAFPVYRPRTFISTGYQGTLGWSLPTALGVKVANPDRPVICVAGDGGFLFCAQELATAVHHRLGVVAVVFNDNAYGNVRRMQKERYGNRIIASELYNPDFVRLAESFGAQGLRAHTPDELRRAIRQGLETTGPTIVEVPVGEMPSPWSFIHLGRAR